MISPTANRGSQPRGSGHSYFRQWSLCTLVFSSVKRGCLISSLPGAVPQALVGLCARMDLANLYFLLLGLRDE